MPCASITTETILVALAVGFGLDGIVVTFLELLLFTLPRRRRASHPRPKRFHDDERLPQAAPEVADPGPSLAENEIGPDRLRELLDRTPATQHNPPAPAVPSGPASCFALRISSRRPFGESIAITWS